MHPVIISVLVLVQVHVVNWVVKNVEVVASFARMVSVVEVVVLVLTVKLNVSVEAIIVEIEVEVLVNVNVIELIEVVVVVVVCCHGGRISLRRERTSRSRCCRS